MITVNFQDLKLPMLGFGTMRLPVNKDNSINQKELARMVDYAMEHGVNYFDTAWPYHGGMSEIAIGKALAKYPRESWYLASKFPGHQISSSYDPAAIFEEQLKKCGVDYFDFYLLHNVYENSMDTYLDERWGILNYFKDQKQLGKIRHLGFSCHGRVDLLNRFLEICGDDMEFCQLQVNWLDWTLQDAKEKVRILNQHHIPVWVMEPLRGGKLCSLTNEDEQKLRSLRPNESIASWSFRFLQAIPGITVILSGMSDFSQMEDNVHTFENECPLSDEERTLLFTMAEKMKNSVPCTSCKYCTPHCPLDLDIPMLIATRNELAFAPALNVGMRLEALPENKQPAACLKCGKCARMCPQQIDIPAVIKELADRFASMPRWADVCREREEAARKLKEE